ncbi:MULTISPECIES: cytochrome P450 [Roseibium]|uniref:cytochrome P450 n=1 Tax=Roseibium TaxID=150830 RepID=UPI00094B64FB|nr:MULTISPECIES: cytochrome P450 [Roseibium]MBO6858971.1 cytochrome P450 [Roseibium sp.]MEC9417294.1 cytochrome P450 [Pseudomonadota bacterium]UFI01540.1 cytochrome P450 [Roseibium aggregatum]
MTVSAQISGDTQKAEPTATKAEDFVPPYPFRYEKMPPVWSLIGMAKRNFLSIWGVDDFQSRLRSKKIFTRELVICNRPDVVREAFQTNHEVLQRKSPQMRHALQPLLGDGLFISDTETWAKRRKVVAPIIHGSRVKGFAPIMIETIEEQRADWASQGEGAEVDALADMAHLTAEIICRTIFGRQLGKDHAAEVVQGFSDYQRHIDQVDILSLFGLPEWLPRFRGRAIKKPVERIMTVLDKIIANYEAQKEKGEASVIGGLLEARDENGEPLSREAIISEAAVIFMAGHETTANTLAWAWFLLSQCDKSRANLQAELDTVLAGRSPTFQDVPNLPYTKAVIEETLRLYPPVPILAREAMADTSIGGKSVPKGSLVMVVPWLMHRNPVLWSKPDVFDPGRFLNPKSKKPNKYGYVPFSIGPRICAGLQFGMTEAILSLAILAQDFELKLKDGTDVQPVARLTLRPGENLPMTLHPRHS